MSSPVQDPWRGVLEILPDVFMPDGNLHRSREGDDEGLESFSSQHCPQRWLRVVDDVLVAIPSASGQATAEKPGSTLLQNAPTCVRNLYVQQTARPEKPASGR